MADAAAKRLRKQQGMPREVAIRRRLDSHPSSGGSRGYSVEFRQREMELVDQGIKPAASWASIYRWKIRLQPHVMTGNRGQSKMSALDMYQLVMYRMVYPNAQADEIRRFLFQNNPINPIIYSRKDITEAEKLQDMRRLRTSTTANQALLPHNILRRWLFWNRPPPVGVLGVPTHVLIDIDECGVFLTTANRRYGKGYVGCRVRSAGPYGHSEKWTLIMAIMPNGFRHVWFRKVGGTTAVDFLLFVRQIIARLRQMGVNAVFMWDNLRSHFSAPLILEVYRGGHEIVPRPAYYPTDGPIEFVFNTFEMELRKRLYVIKSDQDLLFNAHDIIRRMGGFQNYFVHCGY